MCVCGYKIRELDCAMSFLSAAASIVQNFYMDQIFYLTAHLNYYCVLLKVFGTCAGFLKKIIINNIVKNFVSFCL